MYLCQTPDDDAFPAFCWPGSGDEGDVNKKFVTGRLEDLLREYTGQNHREAIPLVGATIEALKTSECDQIAALLRSDVRGRQHVNTGNAALISHLRCALLADTATPSQQELETGVFLAAIRASEDLRANLQASPLAPPRVVRAFASRPRESDQPPTVHLEDINLAFLLSELLPSHDGIEMRGVAGLRHRQQRRSVQLYLVDKPHAQLVLAGVDQRRWHAALEFLSGTADEPAWFGISTPHCLAVRERQHLSRRPRVSSVPALGSSLLRRIRLLDLGCEIQFEGNPTFPVLRWSGGPSCIDVATRLQDPVFGLPGPIDVEWERFESARLRLHSDRASRAAGLQSGIEISLRREASPSGKPLRGFTSPQSRQDVASDSATETTGAGPRTSARGSGMPTAEVLARASRTGESPEAAAAALGPDRARAFDDCSDAQRQLRALLAVHVFNAGQIGAPPKRTTTHTITAYDLTVSPRYDDLILTTNAPDNLVNYLVREGLASAGIPGMRLASRPSGRAFHLIHIPTGGQMTVTSRGESDIDTVDDAHTWSARSWLPSDVPVSREERTELASIPPMSADMTRLLAGLVTRINTRDPQGRWAVGNWSWDPLRRAAKPIAAGSDTARWLWGAQDDWDLQWNGYPFSDDVVASLTDPVIGMAGIDVTGSDQIYCVILNNAAVTLRPWGSTAASRQLGRAQ